MKTTVRVGLTVACMIIALTGCQNPNGTTNNTETGAWIGGAFGALVGAITGGRNPGKRVLIGAAAGAAAGAVVGHVMDQISKQQRAQLERESPQTLETIKHNDEVFQQQQKQQPVVAQTPQPTAKAQSSAPSSPVPASAQDTLTPLTVDDVKALSVADVNTNAIIQEIKESDATYTSAQIQKAQQDSPPIAPTVIAYMKNPNG